MSSPIFIGGMMKSGTSLLRAMLGQHSHIASNLETYWFDIQPHQYEQFQPHIERIAKFFELPFSDVESLYRESDSAEAFLDAFMSFYLNGTDKARWLEKTPKNILYAKRIVDYWPNSRILICIRDPRDVFASFRLAEKKHDAESFGHLWVEQHSALHDALSSQDNIKVVSYASLVKNTKETVSSVLEFLEEPYEEAVVDYKGNDEDYQKVLDITGKKSSTLERMRSPITKDRLGIYKAHVDSKECEMMHDIAQSSGLGDFWLKSCSGE